MTNSASAAPPISAVILIFTCSLSFAPFMKTGNVFILATPSPLGVMLITSTSNSSPISIGYCMPFPLFLAFLGARFLGLKIYQPFINEIFVKVNKCFAQIALLFLAFFVAFF